MLQAEIKMTIRQTPQSKTIPIRLTLSNESGYFLDMHLYREITDKLTGQVRGGGGGDISWFSMYVLFNFYFHCCIYVYFGYFFIFHALISCFCFYFAGFVVFILAFGVPLFCCSVRLFFTLVSVHSSLVV